MTIRYELICGHEDEGTMRDVERLVCFCHQCMCSREIVKVIVEEWFSRCYDCRWKRWWGRNEEIAKDASRRHWRNHNNHRTGYGRSTRPESKEALKKFGRRN